MPRIVAWRPDDHDHSPAQVACRDVARLAVVKALIGEYRVRSGKHLCGLGEIKATLLERPLALGRLKRDPHLFNVPPKNRNVENKPSAELFRLADKARVLHDPELAAARMTKLLAVHGLA
jgi:Protein of unknown function (DUF993)